MKITTEQIKQIIKEELQMLQENKAFEALPEEIQELYKSRWPDEVDSHRKKWEEAIFNKILKDEDHFNQYIKPGLIYATANEFFEQEFGDPVARIIINLTSTFYDDVDPETVLDLLTGDWEAAAEYFETSEEGIEITEYTQGLVNFAWAVASGELPESPYSSKLSEMAKGDVENMVSAYGLYESLLQ